MFGFLVSRIRNYIALSLLLKLMIELNLAHDPMRKDFLRRMKTNIQLKVLVLVTYQKSYRHFRSRNIHLEYIEAEHIFFKTSSDDMLVYGNQQRCLNFTGIDGYCSLFFGIHKCKNRLHVSAFKSFTSSFSSYY